MPERKASWVVLSAAAVLWLALASPQPVRYLPNATQRFFCYFSELKRAGANLSLWDRLAISLVLAGRDGPEGGRENRRPSS